ncbi:MAG: DUF1588 domain-containing protein [Deltaproteobacteria bacterium]|nr:DUF1588 domain-containing protein [Deltaproteobacteria bacterium]
MTSLKLQRVLLAALFILTTSACGDESSDPAEFDAPISQPNETAEPDWAPDCSSDTEHFTTKLWQPFLSYQCISCHQVDSIASNTRMVLSPTNMQHNFETLWELARIEDATGPLLLQHPSGQGSSEHTGGNLIEMGSSNYRALEYWIGRSRQNIACPDETDGEELEPGGDGDGELSAMQPGPRLLRRLSHQEYRNTIHSIFPYSIDTDLSLAPDNVVEGFANNTDALLVSPLLADQYRGIAETVALRAAQNISGHTSCDPEADGPSTCTSQLLAELGQKIFRRPLSLEEAQRYFDLWYDVASEDGYLQGIQWMLTGMLQSPHFLYRSEIGTLQSQGDYQLTSWEIASELSYNLTGTLPDEDLFHAASSGLLDNEEGILSEASRLMQTQAGANKFWEFMESWLGLDQLMLVTRSTEDYPELTPSIRQSMLGQTRRLTQDVFMGGQLGQLFTNSSTYLNEELGQFYGIAVPADAATSDGFTKVSQATEYRGGILTEGAFLTTYAKANSSSPIHRGILVREKLFCQTLPPPPANLDTSPPQMDLSKSTRERYLEHSQNPACSGCHNLIDPIGFTFEHFDGIGRFREVDGIHGIDASGEITGTQHTNTTVNGARELSTQLSNSQDVQACFTEQWLRYTYGLHQEPLLETTLENLETNFVSNGADIQSGLLAMVNTPHFRTRNADPEATDTTAQDLTIVWTTNELLGGREEPILDSPSGPATPEGLSVETIEASRWNSGACFDVVVTNNSDATITWEIEVPLEGNLENIWNAEVTQNLVTSLVVHGVGWNASLAPTGTASFGYCTSF